MHRTTRSLIGRVRTLLLPLLAAFALTTAFLIPGAPAHAAGVGDIDLGFLNGLSGPNGLVYMLALQADGKVVIGGQFTTVNDVARNRVARLNSDGSLDTSFDPGTGADNTVQALALQADGKVVIGGQFTTVNGVARSRIARLNSDGSLDTGFDPGAGANNALRSLTVQADGKVLIGGDFATINGVARSRIARLNSDGSLDTGFNPGTGADNQVLVIVEQVDGKILIGGGFTTINSVARSRIARLNSDGSLDTGFNPGTGANSQVLGLMLQADGKIVIGGDFTTINAVARNYVARLNSDGSLDTGFNVGTGASSTVRTMAAQADGKVVIGGNFTTINTVTRNRIARLNSDGSVDTGFDPGAGASNSVYGLALQADGKIVIGGFFTTVNGLVGSNMARLLSVNTGTVAFTATSGLVQESTGMATIALRRTGNTVGSVGARVSITGGTASAADYLLPGQLDTTFAAIAGADNTVQAFAVQGDGKVLMAGGFTIVNGVARNSIARLNSDGNLDTSFDPGTGANASVSTIALQADGKVLIGGQFTTVNGVARNRIARLNSDGSLDTSFNPGTGASNSVFTLTLQADGKVLIGGIFTTINGVARSRIARLNSDGSLDTSFAPSSGTDAGVYGIAVQADGKLVIGGLFTTVNGVARNRIARLNSDGSLDTSFDPGAGVNNPVLTLALQPDGKVVIGGQFTAVNGVTRNRIARLNSDGSLDTGFDPGAGANASVYVMTLQADGKIVIGGGFTSINGVARTSIARLNSDSSVDSGFNPGVGANNPVYGLATQADGKIVIGGQFSTVNNVTRSDIARLNSDGSLDTGFASNSGTNNIVQALAAQADGKVLIGGQFTNINSVARNRIARLNSDGGLDTSFDPGAGADNTVYALALQADGKVLIGGQFTTVNGVARNRIARLNSDGSLDNGFDPGAGADNNVLTLALQADGKVLIGGLFITVNGVARSRIARLNSDGSLDTGFDPGAGANNTVRTVAVRADGKVLIGGDFGLINGVTRIRIARLNSDGSLDTGFAPSSGADNTMYALAVQADGKVLIGGNFTNINSVARNRIARLNSDGSLDTGFNPGTGANSTVSALALQADGKMVIGGNFTSINGVTRNRIARLNSDGSLDTGFDPGVGASTLVNALALQTDGNVVIGGQFTTVNSVARNYIAQLGGSAILQVIWANGDTTDKTIRLPIVKDALVEGDETVIFTLVPLYGGVAGTPTTYTLTITENNVNAAPTITGITNQTTNEGTATGAISFTVGDNETAAGSLTVSGNSSNQALVPDANIVVGGTGAARTVTIAPASGQYGVATITLTVTDEQATSTSTSFTLAVNGTPRFTSPAGTAINTTAVSVVGQASPGALVALTEGATGLCSVTADGSGSWSCALTLAEGQHTLSATATLNGVTSPIATRSLTVDLSAPATPVVVSANTTSDPTPAFQGTAEPGSTITLGIDLNGDGTVDVTFTTTANGSGAWSIDTDSATPASGSLPSGGLAPGSYALSFTTTDVAGNTSAVLHQTLTIDTGAAVPPAIVSAPDTNDRTPVLSGTAAPGSTVMISIDLDGDNQPDVTYITTADPAGNWHVDLGTATPAAGTLPSGGLPAGNYTMDMTATDPAGNVSSTLSQVLTVDTGAPASPAIGSASTTNDPTPVLGGVAEPGSTVTVGIDLDGNGTPDVTFTTVAGANGSWSIDLGTATPVSGSLPAGGIPDGSHAVTVTTADAAGNSSLATSQMLLIDPAAVPPPTVSSTPSTNDATPILSGTAAPGSMVTVGIDLDGDGTPDVTFTTVAGANGSWSIDLGTATPASGSLPAGGLAAGSHALTVTTASSTGTSAPASQTLTVDATAPAAPAVASPPSTSDRTPVLSGTAEPGSTVTVALDLDGDGTPDVTFTTVANLPSGTWVIDMGSATPVSGSLPAGGLGAGSYGLNITTTDLAGNISSAASTTLTIDQTKPSAPVITQPAAGEPVSATPVFGGTAEPGSTVRLTIDQDGNPATTNDIVTFITVADANGNWSVDTATVTPISGTWGSGLDETATPNIRIVATDPAGNTSDMETAAPTVDTTAPQAPSMAMPAASSDRTPVLSGTAEPGSRVTIMIDPDNDPATANSVVFSTTADATGQWSVDTGSATPVSGTMPADGLAVGTATGITVTARDTAGNISAQFSQRISIGLKTYLGTVIR